MGVQDKVIFDEYQKQWASYVKNLDTVEKEVAKKQGDALKKTKKKLLDAAKKVAKDAMEGALVPAKEPGVKARFGQYEKVATNIVTHHIWYGNKGYGTTNSVSAPKNEYKKTPMTPQERPVFS